MAGTKREGSLQVTGKPGVRRERQLADLALDPLFGGAVIATTFSKGTFGATDLAATYEGLIDRAQAIRGNKLGSAEDMLTAQAAALNAMFLELARRSGANMGQHIQVTESYMRLALKAQAQCRATLETLATIKNPPVVYARQANIATGPQQVNNGAAASRAINQSTSPDELLEIDLGKRLDAGATSTAIGGDPALEAVGAIDRAAHGRRQSPRQRQRRQRREASCAKGGAGADPANDTRS